VPKYKGNSDCGRTRSWRGWAIGIVLSAATSGCLSQDEIDGEDLQEQALGQLEQALYDSSDIRTTAGSAMVDAYFATLADGDAFEYCGLIVKKPAGDFRAGAPKTSRLSLKCAATISLATGEKVVGYYHTHTAASLPGISTADKQESIATKREYFVLSTATGCGEQYSPSTGVITNLGCPF